MAPQFEDVLYDVEDGIATITINRPEVLNAFRVTTVNELITAFRLADADPSVRAIIFTGAGGRAFSSGGDQKERSTAATSVTSKPASLPAIRTCTPRYAVQASQ
jgi:1,4-dihydroxy-2-naphthoyl-CoA synthase